MKKPILILALIATLTTGPALAGDYSSRAAAGGALGGALGAYVGAESSGRDGAILGGIVGAAVGAAIATDGYRHRDRVVVRERYREPVVYGHAYRERYHYRGHDHRHWDRHERSGYYHHRHYRD